MRINALTCFGLAALSTLLCLGCAGARPLCPVSTEHPAHAVNARCPVSTERLKKAKPYVFKATGQGFLEGEEGAGLVEAATECAAIADASGRGMPAANAVNDVQKRLTALEAAKYRAMANLVEKIRGIRVEKVTTGENFRLIEERISTVVSGELKWVKIVEQEYDEVAEIATVTLKVGLDAFGDIVPVKMLPVEPRSLAERRARAETVGRMQAVAKLREQIGEVYVGQVLKVQDFVLKSQSAWLIVEGMVKGVEFSRPSWPTRHKCEVEARLEVPQGEFDRFRAMPAAD